MMLVGGVMETREESIKKEMNQILLAIQLYHFDEKKVRELKEIYEGLKKEYKQLLLAKYTEEGKMK